MTDWITCAARLGVLRSLLILGCFVTVGFPRSASGDLLFFDDFSDGVITDSWTAPTEHLQIVNGRLQATENGRVIRSLQAFSGDMRLEFDLEKTGSSDHIAWDIAAGFIDSSDQKALGILRFDHLGVDAVATGPNNQVIFNGGPATTVSGDAGNQGHATITYQNSVVEFIFENIYGQTLRAPSTTVSITEPFQLWINIAAHSDSPRYIENVKLYSLDAELSGDFNDDGRVDATDYVVWRNGVGTTHSPADYNLWRANFGTSAAGAPAAGQASSTQQVPEPPAIALVLLACSGLLWRSRDHARRIRPGRHAEMAA